MARHLEEQTAQVSFSLPIRVYYADTDAGGIVYHARYLDYAERTRTELLRSFGWPLVGPDGENFVVRKASLDWKAPARLDDLLTCQTTVLELGGASVILGQNILRDDTLLCATEIELVLVSSQGRPTRFPQALRDKFSGLQAAN